MKRGTSLTINGVGLLGVVAVAAMIATRRSPEDALRALVPADPTQTVHLTGPVVPVPTWANSFRLVVRYPGGYEATAEGAVAFVTKTATATITPTSPPVNTPTPCLNSVNPYGLLQRSPYDSSRWWCVNCDGQQIGVPIGARCGPPATPTRAAVTRTPTPVPTVRKTQAPAPTPSWCTDVGHPYGYTSKYVYGWCVNCAGNKIVGRVGADGKCGPLPPMVTPTP